MTAARVRKAKTVLTIAGTRPEAIKLAPLARALEADAELDHRLVLTGQHREIVDEVLDAFDLRADRDVEILRPGQRLPSLAARAMDGVADAIEAIRPDAVVVQGDTTTTFAAAFSAFMLRVPVVHVEAGLRTEDLTAPFPEEANRALTARIADLHLAPTPWARENLLAERVSPSKIVVTGNTVVDALRHLCAMPFTPTTPGLAPVLDAGEPLVIVTSHRRENLGAPQRRIARAIATAAARFPHVRFLLPLHPNPAVRATLVPALEGLPNVTMTEPLRYREMLAALSRATLAVSDSGGIQEEGCTLGVPVLLLREVTERPEGVLAGAVRVVGTRRRAIEDALTEALANPRVAVPSDVFGDGRASERCHMAIRSLLGLPAAQIAPFGAGDEIRHDEIRDDEIGNDEIHDDLEEVGS